MSLRPKHVLVEALKLFTVESKLAAYNKILSKDPMTSTDTEIEIGFALCCDADVQKYLSEHLGKK